MHRISPHSELALTTPTLVRRTRPFPVSAKLAHSGSWLRGHKAWVAHRELARGSQGLGCTQGVGSGVTRPGLHTGSWLGGHKAWVAHRELARGSQGLGCTQGVGSGVTRPGLHTGSWLRGHKAWVAHRELAQGSQGLGCTQGVGSGVTRPGLHYHSLIYDWIMTFCANNIISPFLAHMRTHTGLLVSKRHRVQQSSFVENLYKQDVPVCYNHNYRLVAREKAQTFAYMPKVVLEKILQCGLRCVLETYERATPRALVVVGLIPRLPGPCPGTTNLTIQSNNFI